MGKGAAAPHPSTRYLALGLTAELPVTLLHPVERPLAGADMALYEEGLPVLARRRT